MYTIFCELSDKAPADNGYTTIGIQTSAGTSILQGLYRPAVQFTENLEAKVRGQRKCTRVLRYSSTLAS